MAKKKKLIPDEEKVLDLDDEELISSVEDPVDEDEENEDADIEDNLAEDEDDRQIIAKLEKADREEAEKLFLFEEEIGFNPLYDWTDRSIFPEKEEDDARRLLLEMTAEEVDAYKVKNADKHPLFTKWVLALACKKHDLNDKFLDIALDIEKGVKPEDRLFFADIYLEIIRAYIEANDFEKARDYIAKYKKAGDTYLESMELENQAAENDLAAKKSKKSKDAVAKKSAAKKVSSIRIVEYDDYAIEIIEGIIDAKSGKIAEAKSRFSHLINRPFNAGIPEFENDKSNSEAERRVVMFEIAQSLAAANLQTLAHDYFDYAKKNALIENDKKLILEIENAIDRSDKSRIL